jgi:hypothetical protein
VRGILFAALLERNLEKFLTVQSNFGLAALIALSIVSEELVNDMNI